MSVPLEIAVVLLAVGWLVRREAIAYREQMAAKRRYRERIRL